MGHPKLLSDRDAGTSSVTPDAIVTAFLATVRRNLPAPEVNHNDDGAVSLEWESDYGLACLDVTATEFRFLISPYQGAQGRTYLMDGDIGEGESVEAVVKKMAKIPSLVASRLFG
ncbi:MAG: hypothetical protein ACYCOU_06785 [Sulfobacillus sp.]